MSRRIKRWGCLLILGLLAFTQAGLAGAGCMVNRGDTPRMMGAGVGQGMARERAGRTEPGMPTASACLRHCVGKFQLSRHSEDAFAAAHVGAIVPTVTRIRTPRATTLRAETAPRVPIPIRILLHSFLI